MDVAVAAHATDHVAQAPSGDHLLMLRWDAAAEAAMTAQLEFPLAVMSPVLGPAMILTPLLQQQQSRRPHPHLPPQHWNLRQASQARPHLETAVRVMTATRPLLWQPRTHSRSQPCSLLRQRQ